MFAQTFTAVLLFSLVMAFTPGPNNMMLASSGATYGIRRTLPHLFGVSVGFPVMIFWLVWDWPPSCWPRPNCSWR